VTTSTSAKSLSVLLGDIVKQVSIYREQAEGIGTALLASQKDKVDYHRSAVQALQARERQLMQLIDRAYEEKLGGTVAEDLWNRKSAAWESELANVPLQLRAHQSANSDYYEIVVQILELANKAYGLFVQRKAMSSASYWIRYCRTTLFIAELFALHTKRPLTYLPKGHPINQSGADEARTRDLLRDRQAF
jgi:hypothetical protein